MHSVDVYNVAPIGKIMRLTIPRSQGKQAYYDARKSSWGDIFPHPSKNRPQERFQVSSDEGDATAPRREAQSGKASSVPKRKKSRRDKIRDNHLDSLDLEDLDV